MEGGFKTIYRSRCSRLYYTHPTLFKVGISLLVTLPTNKALDSYPMSTPILFSTSSVELKVLSRRVREMSLADLDIILALMSRPADAGYGLSKKRNVFQYEAYL